MNVKNSKETILNQALSIFGRLGFHKTTMSDIAGAAKRGRRTVYTYFKNKEEVYEAVVEREIDKMLVQFKKEMDGPDNIEIKLSKYIEFRIQSILALTKEYEALKTAFINNYSWVEKIRKKLDEEEILILSRLLRLGSENNSFHIDNIELMTNTIALTLKGSEFLLVKENNEINTKLHIQNLQFLLLNGVKSKI